MKITIQTNHKLFLVKTGAMSNPYVCNLEHVQAVIKNIENGAPYSVYMFWNGKPERCTKQALNEMFEANQINFRIKKFVA